MPVQIDGRGHLLEAGDRVPRGSINTGWVHVPALAPEDVVQIVNWGEDISGNEDDPDAGTWQIRVSGVERTHLDNWLLTIRRGYFRQNETLLAGNAPFPPWIPDTWIDDNATWYYSVPEAMYHPFVHEGLRVAKVGGVIGQGYDPFEVPVLIDEHTMQVRHRPVVCDGGGATPGNYMVQLRISGSLYNGDITLLDKDEGLLRLSIPVDPAAYCEVSYYYQRQDMPFVGHVAGTTYHLLDLNPMPGHTYMSRTDDATPRTIYVASSELLTEGVFVCAIPVAAYNSTTRTWAYQSQQPQGIIWTPARNTIVSERQQQALETFGYGHFGYMHFGQQYGSINVRTMDIRDVDGEIVPRARIVAQVFCRSPLHIEQVRILDSRRRGGGIREDIPKENWPETAKHYHDISSLDGLPVLDNGTVIIRLPASVVEAWGEAFTRSAIERFLGVGVAFHLETTE